LPASATSPRAAKSIFGKEILFVVCAAASASIGKETTVGDSTQAMSSKRERRAMSFSRTAPRDWPNVCCFSFSLAVSGLGPTLCSVPMPCCRPVGSRHFLLIGDWKLLETGFSLENPFRNGFFSRLGAGEHKK